MSPWAPVIPVIPGPSVAGGDKRLAFLRERSCRPLVCNGEDVVPDEWIELDRLEARAGESELADNYGSRLSTDAAALPDLLEEHGCSTASQRACESATPSRTALPHPLRARLSAGTFAAIGCR